MQSSTNQPVALPAAVRFRMLQTDFLFEQLACFYTRTVCTRTGTPYWYTGTIGSLNSAWAQRIPWRDQSLHCTSCATNQHPTNLKHPTWLSNACTLRRSLHPVLHPPYPPSAPQVEQEGFVWRFTGEYWQRRQRRDWAGCPDLYSEVDHVIVAPDAWTRPQSP